MQLTMLLYGMVNHQVGANHMHCRFVHYHVQFPSAPRSKSICNGLVYLWRVAKGMRNDCANALLLGTGGTLQNGFQMARIGHYKGIRYIIYSVLKKLCIDQSMQVFYVHPTSIMFTRKPRTGWVIYHDVEETKKAQ